MTKTLEGIVEAVGTKYNGSLKVDGKWISNKKGFVNPAKEGDSVKVTLEPWSFNGKEGMNISAVEVVKSNPVEVLKAEVKKASYKKDDAEVK